MPDLIPFRKKRSTPLWRKLLITVVMYRVTIHASTHPADGCACHSITPQLVYVQPIPASIGFLAPVYRPVRSSHRARNIPAGALGQLQTQCCLALLWPAATESRRPIVDLVRPQISCALVPIPLQVGSQTIASNGAGSRPPRFALRLLLPLIAIWRAGLPPALRASVMSAGDAGLGMNLLRRTQPCLNSKNEKGPHKGALYSFW
jgi:hypothetical protein